MHVRGIALKVKATDSNSGVADVQAPANKKRPGKLIRYATRLTIRAAVAPKFLRAQDRASNFSQWKRLR